MGTIVKKQFHKNSNETFEHDGNRYNIQHNKYGYLAQVWVGNHYCPIIKGRDDRRKKLSTVNKYMKEYGIEFVD